MGPAEVGKVLEMESAACVCSRLAVALTAAGVAELDGWVGVELIGGRVGVGSADVLIAVGCGEGTLLALLSPANRGSLAFTCGLYMLICEVAVGLELLVVMP